MQRLRNDVPLYPGERVDDLERNGLLIIQNPDRFCFGMDAVLLSGFVSIREGEDTIDLGTGNGILPLLLSAKTTGRTFTGLEIQDENVELAERSVRLNDLSNRIHIRKGDIKEAAELFGAASFDVVVTNPPYMKGDHGLPNPDDAKAIARHEICCTLEDVLQVSRKLLKEGGRFFMVHRPFRLPEIFCRMSHHGIEPKRMRLVYPDVKKEPNMVLIEGRSGGKPYLTVEKPLIVWKEKDVYTEEMKELYGF